MRHLRIIARLDIKGPNLIKGIHLEGLRVVGDPHEHALRYYERGRRRTAVHRHRRQPVPAQQPVGHHQARGRPVYVPITVGGGIRSWTTCRP
jgi:cyclase